MSWLASQVNFDYYVLLKQAPGVFVYVSFRVIKDLLALKFRLIYAVMLFIVISTKD